MGGPSRDNIILSIYRDMAEGVMTIGLSGVIELVNGAALRILNRKEEELLGKRFAGCFFGDPENDAFNQAVLDAVYQPECSHESLVPYHNGNSMRQLRITSSCLKEERATAVILVISDITELAELKDAVRAMAEIKALNDRLELRNKLLAETFGRYISDEVVSQLLDTPGGLALGGRKRELTVMMSDLRGFTALSERMPAQELLAMLNHYLGAMTEEIQRYHGTIIEFIGDGILAIFGAPGERPQHAAEGVAAALAMQRAMADVNAWNREKGYPELEMGIGMGTGEAIVGNIGSEKRTKYGVTGSMVNLCGRIESYTVGGQLLISPRTRELVQAELTVESSLTVKPKGAGSPFEVYSVTGIGAPYDVRIGREDEPLRPLARPCPAKFHTIDGKHVGGELLSGCFTALSAREGLLRTEAALKPYDNLEMEIGLPKRLYAKVLRQENGWLLRFTAKPEGFDAWAEGR